MKTKTVATLNVKKRYSNLCEDLYIYQLEKSNIKRKATIQSWLDGLTAADRRGLKRYMKRVCFK